MTDPDSIQDILYQALQASDVARAAQAVAQGADVTGQVRAEAGEAPGDTHARAFDARHQLITAAAWAPNRNGMDWLVKVNPSLLPSGSEAVSWLGKTLGGSPGAPDMWFADWLVAHTAVLEALNSQDERNYKPWSNLIFKALARTDEEALAWLMKPTSGWQDDPTDPILVRALRYNNLTDYDRNTPHVVFLLNAGVKPLRTTDPLHPESEISPLSELVNAYCTTRQSRAAAGTLVATANPANDALLRAVVTLWPLLVRAGDDPHRRGFSGISPREQLRDTPAEGMVLAQERLQDSLGEAPKRARASRRRS
jgi:hypothetical protein